MQFAIGFRQVMVPVVVTGCAGFRARFLPHFFAGKSAAAPVGARIGASNSTIGGVPRPSKEAAMRYTNPSHPTNSGRLAVVELLAMVTLAIGVGIAAAIVLGSAVLLVSGGDSPAIGTGAAMHSQAVTRS